MGNGHKSVSNEGNSTMEERTKEYDLKNGLILSQHYIPQEVIGHILTFVDVKTLVLSCRLVCHKWREMVENFVLKWKAEHGGYINFKENHNLLQKLDWKDFYWVISKNPFGRNLLENNCGQNGLRGWTILCSGGNGWIIESQPHGTDGLPPVNANGDPHPDFEDLTSCFVTSFRSCAKEQLIQLSKNGLTETIMDIIQPPIQISEWTACRFDCGSVYELKVTLLNQQMSTVKEFQFREDFSQRPREKWYQVTHILKDYGPGVRYILFHHNGVDSQFWAGHYGSKMSGGLVRVLNSCVEYS